MPVKEKEWEYVAYYCLTVLRFILSGVHFCLFYKKVYYYKISKSIIKISIYIVWYTRFSNLYF